MRYYSPILGPRLYTRYPRSPLAFPRKVYPCFSFHLSRQHPPHGKHRGMEHAQCWKCVLGASYRPRDPVMRGYACRRRGKKPLFIFWHLSTRGRRAFPTSRSSGRHMELHSSSSSGAEAPDWQKLSNFHFANIIIAAIIVVVAIAIGEALFLAFAARRHGMAANDCYGYGRAVFW